MTEKEKIKEATRIMQLAYNHNAEGYRMDTTPVIRDFLIPKGLVDFRRGYPDDMRIILTPKGYAALKTGLRWYLIRSTCIKIFNWIVAASAIISVVILINQENRLKQSPKEESTQTKISPVSSKQINFPDPAKSIPLPKIDSASKLIQKADSSK